MACKKEYLLHARINTTISPRKNAKAVASANPPNRLVWSNTAGVRRALSAEAANHGRRINAVCEHVTHRLAQMRLTS